MIDRVKLREQYNKETGQHWKTLCSIAQPTIDYTKWLEDRLVKNCSVFGVEVSCGRNITTCVFYEVGNKCSNLEYCKDQTT